MRSLTVTAGRSLLALGSSSGRLHRTLLLFCDLGQVLDGGLVPCRRWLMLQLDLTGIRTMLRLISILDF
jgi:hypothetical protein